MAELLHRSGLGAGLLHNCQDIYDLKELLLLLPPWLCSNGQSRVNGLCPAHAHLAYNTIPNWKVMSYAEAEDKNFEKADVVSYDDASIIRHQQAEEADG